VILIVTLAGLVACRGGDEATPENVFIADEADSGQTVSMAVGDALQLSLPDTGAPETTWAVVTNDSGVLSPSDAPSYAPTGEATGRVTFNFRAVGPGTSILRLVNAQPQETAVEPAAVYELTISVTE
jgi:predicted secreted protein